MGFSEAVQWWQKCHLQIFALSSLFLQYFLFMTSLLRKRCIASWVRIFIWLAYLGSDAIALYALAALFNYPKSLGVKILWPPILLVHLGGQDCITAYNIEDNELWKRHVLTAMSQVTIAIYVFWKSWSQEKQGDYLAASILLFFPGILKCILKPWDLKRVSMNSLVVRGGSRINAVGGGNNNNISEDFVSACISWISDGGQQPTRDGDDQVPLFMMRPYDHLFVDLAPPNSDRLNCMKYFMNSERNRVHRLVRSSLSVTFDRLYTKESVVHQKLSGIKDVIPNFIVLLRILAAVCILAVIVLVPITEGGARDTDVILTYILLACTTVLEYFIPALIFNRSEPEQRFEQQQWPDQISQYNLLWYLVHNKEHRWIRKLATWLVSKEYLDQQWCMPPSPCSSSDDITKLVHGYLKEGWSGIRDMASYRAFNDNRGHCGTSLRSSLARPFDESVILWHLATDFCFHRPRMSAASRDGPARHSKMMSNYMAYLLFVNPEMLMTGARRGLFRAAYKELKKILGPREYGAWRPLWQQHTQEKERRLAEKIEENIKKPGGREGLNIVNDAWDLAEELWKLRGETERGDIEMWKVIRGVWVEMLCFSAGRCRGFLHAKSLGTGGEYLSYVWLLLLYMGMETLGEKMQRTKLLEEETSGDGGSANAATAPIPPDQAAGGEQHY